MTTPGFELFYGVRLRILGHYLGQFLLIAAALNLLNLVVALIYMETGIAFSYGIVILVFGSCGGFLVRLRKQDVLQLNEAMVVAALVFIFVPLISTLPLIRTGIAFSDALFETVSAVTTTGLSTLGPIEERPVTFAFARAWMQWYGGLGIVVFSLALVLRPGLSALRLSMLETRDDNLAGGTRAHAKQVMIVYLLLTAVGFIAWLLLGGAPVDGLLYILAAVSTGGFAPSSGSFADLEGLRFAWIVTLACLAGAIPLALFYTSWRKGWKHFLSSFELRALLAAGVLATFLLSVCLWLQGAELSAIAEHAPLMALSAQTTSGFSSMNPADLDGLSKGVMIAAMAVGGGIGSTAGGFKLLRLMILIAVLARTVQRMSMPANTVVTRKIVGQTIDETEIRDALTIIIVFTGVVFFSWLFFLHYDYHPLDALFDVVSATGTVGLSTGITGADLPTGLKLVLCVDMLFGRLEFIAWMVLLYPRTWFGRKRGSS